ncbi:GNAT family N-acetyltransferase [Caulobacter sp. CCH9-E1]|jgi:ribosomal protein S18 acetylase RimI-like enzyme|uniref:GNAT family N-acetyltransferase n=1 Tax=Caulobacter sp. CCH9-E1 TaxID=1768768 RepID=UPI0009E7F038|nr:GNAT family N-acetyltransferase [Caulobacter sp. CCH9-E1]
MKSYSNVQNHHVAPAGASHAPFARSPLPGLPPFPNAKSRALSVAPDIALRPARDQDLPFLLRLYGETRIANLSASPWSQAQKQAFIADQFSLQHLHYLQRNPNADFWLIERIGADGGKEAIGRLYLDRSQPEWRAIDLSLLVRARGAGVGGALIRSIQDAAIQAGADAVTLYVEKTNHGARALYARSGFEEETSAFPSHSLMRWRASKSAPS